MNISYENDTMQKKNDLWKYNVNSVKFCQFWIEIQSGMFLTGFKRVRLVL